MKLKVCSKPDCPTLIPRGQRACPDHQPVTATTTERGYGYAHQQERARWQQLIDRAHLDGWGVDCVRCGEAVTGDWHLDHNEDRSGYLGPAHATCNLSAAGKAGAHRGWGATPRDA